MCEAGFQEFPIPPLSKYGVISGNIQEIDEEKENSNIKRIAKFLCLDLPSFLSTFLIVQNKMAPSQSQHPPCSGNEEKEASAQLHRPILQDREKGKSRCARGMSFAS